MTADVLLQFLEEAVEPPKQNTFILLVTN